MIRALARTQGKISKNIASKKTRDTSFTRRS